MIITFDAVLLSRESTAIPNRWYWLLFVFVVVVVTCCFLSFYVVGEATAAAVVVIIAAVVIVCFYSLHPLGLLRQNLVCLQQGM